MSKKKKLTPNQDKYKELQKRLKRKLRDVKKRGFEPNRAFKDEWLNNEVPKRVTPQMLKKLQDVIEIKDKIYQYLKYYSPLRDEYIGGEERRKEERKEVARKIWEARRENPKRALERDNYWYDEEPYYLDPFGEYSSKQYVQRIPDEDEKTFNKIMDMINNWSPDPKWSDELAGIKEEDKNQLKSVLDGAIAELGLEQVKANIAKHETEIIAIISEVLYESGNKFRRFSGSGREGVRKSIDKLATHFAGRPLTVAESRRLSEQTESLNESE